MKHQKAFTKPKCYMQANNISLSRENDAMVALVIELNHSNPFEKLMGYYKRNYITVFFKLLLLHLSLEITTCHFTLFLLLSS